jgi:6-hydroxycyclohex-1-ene-1-carbonyl-CoA dehydrogenase
MRGFRLLERSARAWIEPFERADPEPQGDQLLLELEAAWLPLDVSAPRVAGLGVVGRVLAAGPAAGQLIGRRALACAALGCGDCEVCRRGGVAACPAGGVLGRASVAADALEVGDRLLARARWACPLGDGLELDATAGALVAGPGAIAYSMYARAGLSPGQPVVVLGRGPIARLLERIATSRGGRVVRAAPDREPEAIETDLAVVAVGEGRPRMIFDVGEPGGLALAARLAQAGSALIALARPAPAAVELAPLLARHVTIVGVAGPHPDLVPELAALVVRGEVAVADLAEVLPWTRIDALAETAAAVAVSGGALVVTRAAAS